MNAKEAITSRTYKYFFFFFSFFFFDCDKDGFYTVNVAQSLLCNTICWASNLLDDTVQETIRSSRSATVKSIIKISKFRLSIDLKILSS